VQRTNPLQFASTLQGNRPQHTIELKSLCLVRLQQLLIQMPCIQAWLIRLDIDTNLQHH
jgi:hypothetical protein